MDKYINKVIKIIIEKTGIDPEEINEESYFEEDLNLGELELIDIYDSLEEVYMIEFEDEEKEGVESVMDLVELIAEKIE